MKNYCMKHVFVFTELLKVIPVKCESQYLVYKNLFLMIFIEVYAKSLSKDNISLTGLLL